MELFELVFAIALLLVFATAFCNRSHMLFLQLFFAITLR
jgi:hypothetical protein